MKKIQKVWFACLLDTEGCVALHLYRSKSHPSWPQWRPSLTVGNTNLALLKYGKLIIGNSCTLIRRKQNTKAGSKFYILSVTSFVTMTRVLKEVQPFVIAKRHQVDYLLKALALGSTGTFGWRNHYKQILAIKNKMQKYQSTKGVRKVLKLP